MDRSAGYDPVSNEKSPTAIAPCGPPKLRQMCEQPSTPQGSKAQTPSTLSSTPWREAPKISAPNLGVGNYGNRMRGGERGLEKTIIIGRWGMNNTNVIRNNTRRQESLAISTYLKSFCITKRHGL